MEVSIRFYIGLLLILFFTMIQMVDAKDLSDKWILSPEKYEV